MYVHSRIVKGTPCQFFQMNPLIVVVHMVHNISVLKVLVALKRAGGVGSVVVRRAQLTWSWCTW